MYGFQDGVCFETDLDRLETFHRLGIRVIQPTYNRRNRLGDGCLEPSDAGLSNVGHEAVERMNVLGILVDLSHCGRVTAADAIRRSTRPVAFTHTGCAALADHPRNRTDAELRAVANKGGVSGIYVMPYLCGGRQPTADDVVRHIEHAVNVAGEEHVSIGTDGTLSAIALTPDFVSRSRRTSLAARRPASPHRRSPRTATCSRMTSIRPGASSNWRTGSACAAIRTTGSRRSWAPTCCACSARRGPPDARDDADLLPPSALPGLSALR